MLLCYVIRISGLEGLVTTNAQSIILGKDPKCVVFTHRSVSEILD